MKPRLKTHLSSHNIPLREQELFMDIVGNELGIKEKKDWYSITTQQYRNACSRLKIEKDSTLFQSLQEIDGKYLGRKLLRDNNSSLYSLLKSVYPTYQWDHFLRMKQPKNHWRDIKNQRIFFDNVSSQLESFDEWYLIVDSTQIKGSTDKNRYKRSIKKFNFKGIVKKYYKGSIFTALKTIYPNYPWDISCTKQKPRQYWNIMENKRKFMEEFHKAHHFTDFEDWYSVTNKMFIKFGGNTILKKYHYSIYEILRSVYPNYDWRIEKSSKKRVGLSHLSLFQTSHTAFYRSLLGLQEVDRTHIDPLNQVEVDDCDHNPFSLASLISAIPHHHHHLNYSSQEKMHYSMLLLLQRFFNIRQRKDWERVSENIINKFILVGKSFRHHFGNVQSLLYQFHPHEFNAIHRSVSIHRNHFSRSIQRWLFICCQYYLFPSFLVLEDYYHPLISSRPLLSRKSYDLFIPNTNVAIEYNGPQHYEDIPQTFSPVEVNRIRDQEKLTRSTSSNINLITIPYWWDLSVNSLLPSLLKSAYKFN